MAFFLTNGTSYDIASTYGTAVNMTALSNASAAVATLAAGHGCVIGDVVEITSGWQRLNGRLARVSAVATNDVTLEGIDTTSTSLFPVGMGTGSVRRITAWTEISQVLEGSFSGGEQQFTDITSLADVVQREMPTTRSPVRLELTVGDDPALPWYTPVRAASRSHANTGLRVRLSNGARLLGNGVWAFPETPNLAKNEAIRTAISVALVSELTRATA